MQNILSTAYKQKFQISDRKITDFSSAEDVIRAFEDVFVGVSHNCLNDTCLNDGAEISYSGFDSSCSLEAPGSSSALKNSCMSIVTDLNGVNKRPNKAGKDRFRFWVTKDGVVPEGDLELCTNGYDCTAYVLLFRKFFDYETYLDNNPIIPDGCYDKDCNACEDGYLKNGNSCVPLANMNCAESNAAVCTTCAEGYHLDNGSCYVNLPNCLAHSGENCTNCGNGYILSNGQCEAIPVKKVAGLDVYNTNNTGSLGYASSNCSELGMRLPTISELQSIRTECNSLNAEICNTSFWASEGVVVRFNDDGYVDPVGPATYQHYMCIKD